MHLKDNEKKYVVAGRFIRNLKKKIYKYLSSILKNSYINKLHDTADSYNNTYHRPIKMKPVDVKSGKYIDFNVKYNYKDAKF